MFEKWIKVAIMRNLPKHIIKDLAIQLKGAQTTGEVRHIINIYMHDYQTGMPRGQTGPMLCMAANETPEDNANIKIQDKDKEPEPSTETNKEDELNAATKGKGKGKKNAKGYGECWHCGEWGHPRRECPHSNDPAKGQGSLSALKGAKS